jgi:hypothetical protein
MIGELWPGGAELTAIAEAWCSWRSVAAHACSAA